MLRMQNGMQRACSRTEMLIGTGFERHDDRERLQRMGQTLFDSESKDVYRGRLNLWGLRKSSIEDLIEVPLDDCRADSVLTVSYAPDS